MNNTVSINGTLATDPLFTHESHGECFYEMKVSVKRLSGQYDILPLVISERLLHVRPLAAGFNVSIVGQLRTRNVPVDGKSKLMLSIFVQTINEQPADHHNSITLTGYLCKPPVYRSTPLGREITDIMLAVNRPTGRSDYIPCVIWGRNARYAQNLQVGNKILVTGRVQSREYSKNEQTYTAYEVSVSQITAMNEQDVSTDNIHCNRQNFNE